jgi:hypothetical protein
MAVCSRANDDWSDADVAISARRAALSDPVIAVNSCLNECIQDHEWMAII